MKDDFENKTETVITLEDILSEEIPLELDLMLAREEMKASLVTAPTAEEVPELAPLGEASTELVTKPKSEPEEEVALPANDTPAGDTPERSEESSAAEFNEAKEADTSVTEPVGDPEAESSAAEPVSDSEAESSATEPEEVSEPEVSETEASTEVSETEVSDTDRADTDETDSFTEPSEQPLLQKDKVPVLQLLYQFLFPGLVLFWNELAFHITINGRPAGSTVIYLLLFSLAFGFLYAAIVARIKDKVVRFVNGIALAAVTTLFVVQAVYQQLFNTYLTIYVAGNAGDAKQFWRAAVSALFSRGLFVVLAMIPIAVYVLLRVLKRVRHSKVSGIYTGGVFAMSVLMCVMAMGLMNTKSAVASGRKNVFFKEWQVDRGIKENGLLIGFVQDVKMCLTYDETKVGDVVIDQNPIITLPPIATPEPIEVIEPTIEVTQAPMDTPTPTPTPIDRSPQVMPIDFASLALSTSNKSHQTINEYVASLQPSRKNAYTGMFEGYNLVMITAETFSPLAVREDTTPTLYRLVREGFVFNNFYVPYWMTSTSDGEYTACTGLLPDTQKSNSFSRSSKNLMPFCLGNLLKARGYTTFAFHNHDYTYYDRHKSHPNMGYTYLAKWSGLNVTHQFPESDVEMMELSIPMYVDKEPFHAYYMTMSGHGGYTWDTQAMSRKHKSQVGHLKYSEPALCYLAANIELNNAIEYLIEKLDEAGVLDHTLIVLGPDHYAYLLEAKYRNELVGHNIEWDFELFESNLIIWNPNITKPVQVNKVCSNIDILPTVLNLMGIEYDSRLLMGSDILSDTPGLVQFKDNCFATDYVRYNANTGKATWLNGAEDNWDDAFKKNYLNSYKTMVKNRFNISRAILNTNYYESLRDYFWWMNTDAK